MFLRPVLMMILCNDIIYPESREIWRHILKKGDNRIVMDVLSLRRVTNPSSCLFFNSLIVLKSMDIETFLLLIASTKSIVKNSLDPTQNIQLMLDNAKVLCTNSEMMTLAVFMLSEILQSLSIVYMSKFISLLSSLIIDMNFNHPVILSMILDGLIQVLAYPSFAGKEIKQVEKLLNHIQSHEEQQIPHFNTPDFYHFNADIMNAYYVCKFISINEINLKPIATGSERIFWLKNQLLLRGLLHSDRLNLNQWEIALQNLTDVSKSDDVLKSSLVMPLLFRLANTTSPRKKFLILMNLTRLGASNEIFNTIKALSQGMIRSMAIELNLRLWKVEPRTYPFLHKILIEKTSKDDEDLHLNIARAAAIKEICDLKPHHGTELVSLISEILNQSLESKDAEIPAALAIDAITILCQNHIINQASTWKAINLTTRYEKRPRVVKSLCNFFALVPKFKRNNSEYEMLMKDILARLFHMIQWSDTCGIEYALEALKSWNYDQLTLDMIPDAFRDGIALPDAPAGMEVSLLDLEVPGDCYVQLLTKIHPTALRAAGELVSHFMAQEIAEYRSGHYLVKEGQAEPISYKNLPKQSIVKALSNFIFQQATTKKKEKIVNDSILIEAIRVLAKRHSRPLPPLNWTFLHEMIHRDGCIKAQCIALAAKQSIISGSAKRLIENILINIEFNDQDEVEAALDCLVDICNGVSIEVLKIFFKKAVLFDQIKQKLEMLLKSEKNVTNRENLATIISIYINQTCETSNEVIKLLPPNIMPLLTLNSLQKIKFRCEILKEQTKVDNAVGWINELIIEEHTCNENGDFLVKSLIDLLTDSKQNFPKKKWLAEFLIMVENKMIEGGDFEFFLDIFSLAIICMSGTFELIESKDIFDNRFKMLPYSIESLSHHHEDIIGSIFDFIIERSSSSFHYREAFTKSIIASKNHSHFKKVKTWHKVLQTVISN